MICIILYNRLIQIIVKTIKDINTEEYNGYIIEGYPETIEQAKLLEKYITGYSDITIIEPLYPSLHPLPDKYIPKRI